jgi:N-methylhydantoinase B
MSGAVDPIALQVLIGALRSACEEMGAVLVRSAHSPNIKERRDCSTALFDARGELVMQAAQIPVHLGSMPEAVAAVIGEEQHPGDLWILNDPYRGGTHLPDITLISPVFHSEELIGFAASRAHHADVGGPTPGGMPFDSHTLADEGVVIPPTRVDSETFDSLAAQMRNPTQRLADLRAQQAANATGANRLQELCQRMGTAQVQDGLEEILAYAERRMRAALAALPDGTGEAEDFLESPEDGSDIPIRVRAELHGEELRLDFAGSAEQTQGNLNCPASVTHAACLYAVRVVFDPDAPPSAGSWRPVTIEIPKGTLLDAEPPAAVVAGNVETSSRVADVVVRALGAFTEVAADGQGTMNNLTLSSEVEGEAFTYYETIGGGQGASADVPGPNSIHVAMSNTLNTPIEALELEYPLRVRELAVRRGSGGVGARHDGGDGIVREIEALIPMRYGLISERRKHAPQGRNGGSDGAPGRDTLNGEPIPAKSAGDLKPGDVLKIETPGGGGYGG